MSLINFAIILTTTICLSFIISVKKKQKTSHNRHHSKRRTHLLANAPKQAYSELKQEDIII